MASSDKIKVFLSSEAILAYIFITGITIIGIGIKSWAGGVGESAEAAAVGIQSLEKRTTTLESEIKIRWEDTSRRLGNIEGDLKEVLKLGKTRDSTRN
jgi:hypothetical protein